MVRPLNGQIRQQQNRNPKNEGIQEDLKKTDVDQKNSKNLEVNNWKQIVHDTYSIVANFSYGYKNTQRQTRQWKKNKEYNNNI